MTKKEIATILKNLRVDAGLTQMQAASAINRNAKTLASWETGQSQPDANTLFHLCDVYGVNIDEAFGYAKRNIPENFTQHEISIVKKYRCLNDHGKSLIDTLLEHEYQSATGEQVNNVS